jgi:hypothetical protein
VDENLFLEAVPRLLEVGFSKRYRFRGNGDVIWEYVFVKDGAKFPSRQ